MTQDAHHPDRRGVLAAGAAAVVGGGLTLPDTPPRQPGGVEVGPRPDVSQPRQDARYNPAVPPFTPGVYDLGDVGRTDVAIPSDGLTLAGHLYSPPGADPAAPLPTVVIDAPGSSNKEITVPVYAIRLAGRGYRVLSYDRRGYGASEGVPQHMDPNAHIRDIRNATTFALSQDGVDGDRLGLLGICMGAGLSLQAAAYDRRYRALACVAGHYTAIRIARETGDHAAWIAAQRAVNDQRLADFEAGRPLSKQAFLMPGDPPDAALADMPEARDFYTSRQATVGPTWKNEMTFESNENLSSFDAIPHAGLISPTPVLFVHSTVDVLSPARYALAAFEAAGEPKRLVWIEADNHAKLYDIEPWVTQATDEVLAWFDGHL